MSRVFHKVGRIQWLWGRPGYRVWHIGRSYGRVSVHLGRLWIGLRYQTRGYR